MPPPITISSGSNTCIKLTMPTPKFVATSCIRDCARLSPAFAASATILASTADVFPSAVFSKLLASPADRRSWAMRATAVPEAMTSRQPTLPQLQVGPFLSMVM